MAITYSTYNGFGRQYKNLKVTDSLWGTGTLKLDFGSDAQGDTYYRNSAGFTVRLPIGAEGYVKKVIGGLPSWQPDSGGGGGGLAYSAGPGINITGTQISNTFTHTSQLTNDSNFITTSDVSQVIGDGGGVAKFTLGNGQMLRLEQGSGVTLAFDAATKKVTFNASVAHTHIVGNAGGTQQFPFAQGEMVRFSGTGSIVVTFNPTTKTINFDSPGGLSYSAGAGISIAGSVIANTRTKLSQLTNDSGFITTAAHVHNIANASGTVQFTFGIGETLRIAGTGSASVSFSPATKTITINATGGAPLYSAGTGISINPSNVISNTFTHTSQLTNDSGFITSLAHTHSVFNAAGTQQFTYGIGQGIRFEGTGGITATFDAAAKKVTFSAGLSVANTQVAFGNASSQITSSSNLAWANNTLSVNAGSQLSGGFSLDGINQPSLSLHSAAVLRGALSVVTTGAGYFTSSVAGDIALNAYSAGRVLLGQGSGTAELTVGITTTVNSLAGTGTRLVTANASGRLAAITMPNFSPAGANTMVQYNDSGVFGADANYTWNKGIRQLEVTGQVYTHNSGSISPTGNSSMFAYGTWTLDNTLVQNSGAVYTGAVLRSQETINGNVTINNNTIHSGQFGWMVLDSFVSGATTLTPASSGEHRAISAIAAAVHTAGISAAVTQTISDVAGIHVFPLYQPPGIANCVTITNYYGILIGRSDEITPVANRVTNRYGLYQSGINDKNYFAGKVEIRNNLELLDAAHYLVLTDTVNSARYRIQITNGALAISVAP